MGSQPEVTVIIPNYNGKQLLENCIASLEQQTCPAFRVLVVDNGSTDGSASVRSEVLDLEVLALGENTGFDGAVNAGIRRTETPYVILLNNDPEAEPRFVEELLAGIRRADRIFSCGALMIDYHDRRLADNAGDLYTVPGWAAARGKGKPVARFEKECGVFSCCAGAAIYRTRQVKELGGFDELHFAYLEDVDIGYRARIHGYVNRYIPAARVYHIGSASTGSRYNEKKVYLAARNSMYVIYKNMPLLQLLLHLVPVAAGILVKTTFFVKKGLAGEYLRGIRDGIITCRKCRKVQFQAKNIKNYIRIEWDMWTGMFRLLLER